MKLNKRVSALAGSVAIAGAAVALTAGTFSYFSDTGDSGTQSVRAGTLSVRVGGASDPAPIAIGDVAPGDPAETTTITVQNTGSLPGTLSLDVTRTSAANNLSATLLATVHPTGGTVAIGQSTVDAVAAAPMRDMDITLQPGATQQVQVAIQLPAAAGNIVQGQSVAFTLTARLDQAH